MAEGIELGARDRFQLLIGDFRISLAIMLTDCHTKPGQTSGIRYKSRLTAKGGDIFEAMARRGPGGPRRSTTTATCKAR